jgi:hypothetical protein
MSTVPDELELATRARTGGPENGAPTDGYAIAALITALVGFLPLPLALALIALSRTRHNGTRGRGLAIAALWISGAWVLITIALFAVLVGMAMDIESERNADKYTSVQRQVAIVIDRYEDELNDGDGERVCMLMSESLMMALDEQDGSCAGAVEDDDHWGMVHLDATEITITDPDHAVARVKSLDDRVRMTFVREDGQWRIDEIGEAP